MTRWGDGFMAWPAGSRPRRAPAPGGPAYDSARIEVEPAAPDAPADLAGPLSALDEELGRLPAKYRDPVVLCHLEGLTHAEAAARLRWPVGTVSGRLSRARGLLKDRLIRRGLAPTAGSLVALLATDGARAAVPEPLAAATVRAAASLARGAGTASGLASASAFSLMDEVLRAAVVLQAEGRSARSWPAPPLPGPRSPAGGSVTGPGSSGTGRRSGDRDGTSRPPRAGRRPSRRPSAGR